MTHPNEAAIPYRLPSKFQITLWDYVRYGANDFLGEVIIDLAIHPLDDEPEWYTLQPHQESLRDTVRNWLTTVLNYVCVSLCVVLSCLPSSLLNYALSIVFGSVLLMVSVVKFHFNIIFFVILRDSIFSQLLLLITINPVKYCHLRIMYQLKINGFGSDLHRVFQYFESNLVQFSIIFITSLGFLLSSA